ncbi:SRPBCC domain-containing protein [Streptomyces sp. NPDC050264]|uniref:SRPBCC domain-containing protein n=1 Tax=Streptomyces sp. NPDC050264 TaxID=3155038 RepID=UPI00342805CA
MTITGVRLTLDDGRTAVRLTRTHARPIERVWSYVTDPADLRRWFPSAVEARELRPGAVIRFSGDPNMPEPAGTVLAADTPRHSALPWGGDELRLDLEPLDDGDTGSASPTSWSRPTALRATPQAGRSASASSTRPIAARPRADRTPGRARRGRSCTTPTSRPDSPPARRCPAWTA